MANILAPVLRSVLIPTVNPVSGISLGDPNAPNLQAFDPANMNVDFVLSQTSFLNDTAIYGGTDFNCSVRTTPIMDDVAGGKIIEFMLVAANSFISAVGICNNTFPVKVAHRYFGDANSSIGLFSQTGNVVKNTGTLFTLGAVAQGDLVLIAEKNGEVWFSTGSNSNWNNDPSASPFTPGTGYAHGLGAGLFWGVTESFDGTSDPTWQITSRAVF